jgi:hypothetical protein
VHLDQPFVIFDNAVNDGEAEAGALADSFRGEKGLEQAGANAVRHSSSGVDDFDANIFARLGASVVDRGAIDHGSSQAESAALGHRVASVHAKIEQGLSDLVRIGHDHRQLGTQLQGDIDRFWQRLLQQIGEAGNQLIGAAGDQTGFGLAR